MTKEHLEQYRWLPGEIAHLRAELEGLELEEQKGVVHDILNDPETSQETVRSVREIRERIRQTLAVGLHRAEEQCAEIEAEIIEIGDPHIQRCVILRYVDGLSYKKIAAMVGGTPDAVKKSLYRFFQAQAMQGARP